MGIRAPAPPLLQVAQAWDQGLKLLLEVRCPGQGQAAGRGGVDGGLKALEQGFGPLEFARHAGRLQLGHLVAGLGEALFGVAVLPVLAVCQLRAGIGDGDEQLLIRTSRRGQILDLR